MARARPDWEYAGCWVERELPADVANKIREVLPGYPGERIEAMITGCSRAYAYYQIETLERPSTRDRGEAVRQISKEARSLSRKLDNAGGALLDLHFQLARWNSKLLKLDDIQAVLDDLADAALCAETDLMREYQEEGRRPSNQVVLAILVAEQFTSCLDDTPKASVQREYERAHPYVSVVKIMLEHCTGRMKPLTTVEHIAREALSIIKQHEETRD